MPDPTGLSQGPPLQNLHLFYILPSLFRKATKCVRKPRISSNTVLLVRVWIPSASDMAPANLLSLTPNTILPFFLMMGRFSLRKVDNYYVILPVPAFRAFSRAV